MKKMKKVLALLTAGALLFGCMFTSCSNGSSGDESGDGSGSGGNSFAGKKLVYYDQEDEVYNLNGELVKQQIIYTYKLNNDGTYVVDVEEKYSGQKRENFSTGNYEIKGTTFILTGTNSEGNSYKTCFLIVENNIITLFPETKYDLTISYEGTSVQYDFHAKADFTYEITPKGKTKKISYGSFYIDGSVLLATTQDGEIFNFTIGENNTLTGTLAVEEEKEEAPVGITWIFLNCPEGIGDKTYETVKDLPILLYGENKEIITGKLRATGKWAWDDEKIYTDYVPGLTAANASTWTSRSDTSWLTLTLKAKYRVAILNETLDSSNSNSFVKIYNENNSAMSVQGGGWYILPAGTYTIVTNGVKIESIVCNLQK